MTAVMTRFVKLVQHQYQLVVNEPKLTISLGLELKPFTAFPPVENVKHAKSSRLRVGQWMVRGGMSGQAGLRSVSLLDIAVPIQTLHNTESTSKQFNYFKSSQTFRPRINKA